MLHEGVDCDFDHLMFLNFSRILVGAIWFAIFTALIDISGDWWNLDPMRRNFAGKGIFQVRDMQKRLLMTLMSLLLRPFP
jgi:hypothetical protein